MKVRKHVILLAALAVSLLLLLRHSYERVPAPRILAAGKPAQCYPHKLPRILVVVVTHDEGPMVRDIFREGPMLQSWRSCHGKPLEVSWKFSLEYTSPLYEGYIPYKLALESDTHGDMVETVETRYMLTRPRLRVLEEIIARFDWDFLVISAQSTVVRVGALLDQLPAPHSPFYGGFLAQAPDGTVYAREELTVLSRITLANLLSGLRYVVREPKNDPVTIGRIAAKLQIPATHISGGYNVTGWGHNCVKEAVYLTSAEPRYVAHAYSTLARIGSFC